MAALTRAEKHQLWRAGRLKCEMHESQREVYAGIQTTRAKGARRFVMEVSRKWGKTFLLCLLSIESCLRIKGSRAVLGGPSLKHLEEFIQPIMREIIELAPPECVPVWRDKQSHWVFPNGSWIHVFAADDLAKAKRGRGPKAEFAGFDEAAFTPVLDYVLKEVFRPSMLYSNGMTVLSSSPADEPDHHFTRIAELEEKEGNYANKNIDDNPLLTEEKKAEFLLENARQEGMTLEEYLETDSCQREYFARRVIDKTLVVVPPWTLKRDKLFRAIERPDFFRGLSVLDFGGNDPHAATLGYWHPTLPARDNHVGAYVIEHEVFLHDNENSEELAEALKVAETTAWGVKAWEGTMAAARDATLREFQDRVPPWMRDVMQKQIDGDGQPWMRVCDNDIQLSRDLYELHDLAFVPTAKDNLRLQVNNLCVAVRREQLYVHPRCVKTDEHLRTTKWENAKRREFAHNASGEHGDAVACLVYGLRNIDKRDPTPEEARPVLHNVTIGSGIRAELAKQERREGLNRQFMGATPLGRKLMRGLGRSR